MKKLIIISILLVLSFFATPFSSFAQEQSTTTLSANQTVDGPYFAANDRVIISGSVNGDIYAAGGELTFDGTAGNDLLIAGGNVTISGNVEGDIRVGGGNVIFSGATVNGNVTIAGGSITIDPSSSINSSLVVMGGNIQVSGPVAGSVTVLGGNVVIASDIGGEVWAPGVGALRLANNASINGDLTYVSSEKVLMSDGATVSGVVKQQLPPQKPERAAEGIAAGLAGIAIFFLLADFLVSLIFGLLFIYFLPNFTSKVAANAQIKIGISALKVYWL